MTGSKKETTEKNPSSSKEPVKTAERAKGRELTDEELGGVSGGLGGSHGDDTPVESRSIFRK
jgi:hypothetical protein